MNKLGAKRLRQIVWKVLTLSKYFKFPAFFATALSFADDEHISFLQLITANC